jgi:hypothetical protein
VKDLTKKLIESGIVSKTMAQLFQRWGSLTPEEYTQITNKQVVSETLELFMEELEILLQPEALDDREVVSLDRPSQESDRGLV